MRSVAKAQTHNHKERKNARYQANSEQLFSAASTAKVFSLDTFGIASSSLCALHCLLVPFIIAALPLMAGRIAESDYTHQFLALFVVAFALLAIIPGYIKHRNKLVLLAAGLGLSLVLFATYDKAASTQMELLLMTMGNLLMLSTHYINRRLTKCAC